ncbi:MAG TPA: DUF2007 domain-containing protein [Limnobacter sp.]|nr:DUF2007 domain-containing protein [Limnobacter sp.]
MHLVYQADNLIEAHIVAGMLQSCEIAVHVGGHYLQGGVGDLSPAGMVSLYVMHAEQLPLAQTLLAQYQRESSMADLVSARGDDWQVKPI